MNEREVAIATQFNILNELKNLESELLRINHATKVEFDINGLLDEIHQIIFIVHFENLSFEQMTDFKRQVIKVARHNELNRTGDSIEDYGNAFYFVTAFSENSRWWRK